MANYLENFGLDFFRESEDTITGLIGFVAQEGKPIIGYYSAPYFNLHLGDVQMIVRTEINEEKKAIEVMGLDTHCTGRAVWKARLSDMNLNKKDADKTEYRCALHCEDGKGMAIVNLVNADVLPCFAKDEPITLQMLAFAVIVEYFEDEDHYADAQLETRPGKKWLLAEGAVFPSGLLQNRNPESEEFEKNDWMNDHVLIRGTVKQAFWGDFELKGKKEDHLFIRCLIDTEFGPLELIHTMEQVPEEQRRNIKPGAVVSGVFVLSGDAAIYEYENGMILDEAHDLAALRYVFLGGDPERLRYALAEDAIYQPGYYGDTYTGRDEIIARFRVVQNGHGKENEYFAHWATIVKVDDGDEPLPYEVGKRCIVLASGDEASYESIAFIEANKEGRIQRLTTSTNSRYHFQLDERYQRPDPFEEVTGPANISEAMLIRARFQGIVDDDAEDDEVLSVVEKQGEYRNRAVRLLSEMPSAPGEEKKKLANLFGYLFAKAAETHYADAHPVGIFRRETTVALTPGDVWVGKVCSDISNKASEIEEAMNLGKQFHNDFLLFHPIGEEKPDSYDSDMIDALLLVQRLGVLYAQRYLG